MNLNSYDLVLSCRVVIRDSYFHQYLTGLERLKPVILTGDLNVAHLDIDIYNFKAKHIEKQSGTTPQERESFSALLGTTFQDALRYFHPGTVQCSISSIV
jgi:exonuclease III